MKYVPKDRPIVLTGALYQLTKNNNLTPDPSNARFSVQSGEIVRAAWSWKPRRR